MKNRSRHRSSRKRGRWLLAAVIGLFLCTATLLALSFSDEHYFADIKKITDSIGLVPEVDTFGRGVIFDRNFKQLAVTLEQVSVYVRPREIIDLDQTVEMISAVLDLDKNIIRSRCSSDSLFVWLAKNITQDDEDVIKELNLSGIHLDRELIRYYPHRKTAAHLLGYSENNVGIYGVERYYNRLLSQRIVSSDDLGNVTLDSGETTLSGAHLVLTLDLKIQNILEKQARGLASGGDARTAILLMEADSGAVIAAVTYPAFDPNSFFQVEQDSFQNLLLENVPVPETLRRFFCDVNAIRLGKQKIDTVLPWSISASGRAVAHPLMWEKIGLTGTTNHDLPGKEDSLQEYRATKVEINTGTCTAPQTTTPFHLLTAMAHCVNGGQRITPHVLDRVVDRETGKEFLFTPVVTETNSVFLRDVAEESFQLLKNYASVVDGWKVLVEGRSLDWVYRSGGELLVENEIMISVVPADNPNLLLLVQRQKPYAQMEDEQKGDIKLSAVGARVIPQIAALQQVRKTLQGEMHLTEQKDVNVQGQKTIDKKRITGPVDTVDTIMPDLKGVSLRKALGLLQGIALQVRASGSGHILSQRPRAGEKLTGDRVCYLTLSNHKYAEN